MMVKMAFLLREIAAVAMRKVKPLGLLSILVVDMNLVMMFLVQSEVSSAISSFLNCLCLYFSLCFVINQDTKPSLRNSYLQTSSSYQLPIVPANIDFFVLLNCSYWRVVLAALVPTDLHCSYQDIYLIVFLLDSTAVS